MKNERLIVGVSGASGAPLAAEVLRLLKPTRYESHLILTHGAEMTIPAETGMSIESFKALADVVYDNKNIGAGPASGSFRTAGMIVVPCSMKTAAGIHSGYSDNLLLRAADVTLKERRKLVLVAREAPLSTIHLRNLYELSLIGAVILPPMLNYYCGAGTIEDLTRQTAERVLDQFDCAGNALKRWEGMP